MIYRSLALISIGFVLVAGAAHAQTPVLPAPVEGDARSFSFFFDGDDSYLGVQTEEITKDNFAKYGLSEVRGIAVEKVVEGSPAEKAGIQPGDVIVRFANEEVTSVRKLSRLLRETSPDHQVKVTVIRAGAERELTATLGKRPMTGFDPVPPGSIPRVERFPGPSGQIFRMPLPENFPQLERGGDQFVWQVGSGRRIGVGVTTLTPQLSEHFGVKGGLMINEVRADSPAAKAGLKAGDIIVEADGKEVNDQGDLIRAIAEKKEGDVSLTIVRDRNRQTVRVTPEESRPGTQSYYIIPQPPDAPQKRSLGLREALRPPKLFPNGMFPRIY